MINETTPWNFEESFNNMMEAAETVILNAKLLKEYRLEGSQVTSNKILIAYCHVKGITESFLKSKSNKAAKYKRECAYIIMRNTSKTPVFVMNMLKRSSQQWYKMESIFEKELLDNIFKANYNETILCMNEILNTTLKP
ncbi:MAG: hypothetical protein ABI241_00655 [Bacteroidia bacterium]